MAAIAQTAANVRAELGRQRRTRRDLAAALDVDEHRVSKRVRGLVPFSPDELIAAAAFLGVTVEDLAGRAEDGEQPHASVGAA